MTTEKSKIMNCIEELKEYCFINNTNLAVQSIDMNKLDFDNMEYHGDSFSIPYKSENENVKTWLFVDEACKVDLAVSCEGVDRNILNEDELPYYGFHSVFHGLNELLYEESPIVLNVKLTLQEEAELFKKLFQYMFYNFI